MACQYDIMNKKQEIIMEFLQIAFDNSAVILIAIASLVSSAATIITVFVPDSKVGGFLKPIVSLLNKLAGNVLKNKNKDDT